MADGLLEFFRRALLGRGLFAHVTPMEVLILRARTVALLTALQNLAHAWCAVANCGTVLCSTVTGFSKLGGNRCMTLGARHADELKAQKLKCACTKIASVGFQSVSLWGKV